MQKSIPSLIIASAIMLASCSPSSNGLPGNTTSLNGLKAMANTKRISSRGLSKSVSKIREAALKEIALSLGAQSGLAWRARIIDEQLDSKSRYLDKIYDFNALVLEHNILPPVLLEGRNTLNLADTQTIRISDRTYKVGKQARFVTTPPTWRQYLWMDYIMPERPEAAMLPKNRIEKQLWAYYVTKGWEKGVEQGNTIMEENIARLKEDFAGMILYRKLLAMNMISAPFVSHTDLGITGDASEIRIDDRVLRIAALPALNINSDEWKAAVAKDENALEQFKNMEKVANRAKITITNKSWQPVITPTG